MNSYYKRSYFNERKSSKKVEYIQKRQEILDLEYKIKELKFKFGDFFCKT